MKNKKRKFKLFSSILFLFGLYLVIKNYLAEKKSKEEFPALGRFCSVQGCSIHYYSEGKGSPIVFIHGENGDLYDLYLSDLWNKLKEEHTVVAIDRPGYGYSSRAEWKNYGLQNQAQILHETIQLLGLEKPTLLSYGDSAGIVLAMLMEHSEDYTKAVLVGEKAPEKVTLLDNLLEKPVLGATLVRTVLPFAHEVNVKLNPSKDCIEYDKKAKEFDSHASKLLVKAENKKFMSLQELERISEFTKEVNTPITVINTGIHISQSLFDSSKIKKLFKNVKTTHIGEANLIAILNSYQTFNEIVS